MSDLAAQVAASAVDTYSAGLSTIRLLDAGGQTGRTYRLTGICGAALRTFSGQYCAFGTSGRTGDLGAASDLTVVATTGIAAGWIRYIRRAVRVSDAVDFTRNAP